ncbi:MAG TPA: hypothetical protein VF941_07755 [Clostridia bacterium]
MYKFITIRCICCNSVICNLPEGETSKLKFKNLICEDCIEHDTQVYSKAEKDSSKPDLYS